jgi:hypothetical protein
MDKKVALSEDFPSMDSSFHSAQLSEGITEWEGFRKELINFRPWVAAEFSLSFAVKGASFIP